MTRNEFNKELIDEMIHYILQHLGESLRISHLAQRCGFSQWYLQRLFKKHMGIPIGSYIQRMRLEGAVRELISNDRPLIDVAFSYGYDTQQTFTRAVSNYFGMPPGVIRQLNTFEKATFVRKLGESYKKDG